jgi:hypothetical protein
MMHRPVSVHEAYAILGLSVVLVGGFFCIYKGVPKIYALASAIFRRSSPAVFIYPECSQEQVAALDRERFSYIL